MRRILNIYVFLLVILSLTCCNRYDVDDILLVRDDLSLTFKGTEELVYDSVNWQYGCNVERGEYWVNDDEMANYYVLKCRERPSVEGQEVVADVEWTRQSDLKRFKGIRFSVRKTSADGRIWLWSKSQKIGIVIKEIY